MTHQQQIEPHTMDKGVELGCPSCVWVSKQKKVTPPIESPEEKCEHCDWKVSSYRNGCPGCGAPMCCQNCCKESCLEGAERKGTCEVEEGWEKEFDNRFGLGLYTRYATQTTQDKMIYEEMSQDVKSFLRSEIAKARQEGREDAIKQVEEKVDDVEKREFEQWSTKHSEFIRVSDSTKHNILSAVKDCLSELKK